MALLVWVGLPPTRLEKDQPMTTVTSRSTARAPRGSAILAILAGTVLVLAGCGNSETKASSNDVFNDADVRFATEMIPHHAQALVMVDMTRGRDLDPAFEKLTEQISAAQGPEIETMTQWLRDWDQSIPETSRDHVNAGDMGEGSGGVSGDGEHGMGGMDDQDMPGMMGNDELDELEASPGSAFEARWLEMMIEHHEGAIEMARTEVADGTYADSIALAQAVITGQEAEITQMKMMLGE